MFILLTRALIFGKGSNLEIFAKLGVFDMEIFGL